MSEMFKSSDCDVYTCEIELVLEEHALVSMAAVVGIPGPTFQEVGVASVVGSDDIDTDEVRDFARDRLVNYKIPKQTLVFDDLPMIPVDKVVLRKRRSGS